MATAAFFKALSRLSVIRTPSFPTPATSPASLLVKGESSLSMAPERVMRGVFSMALIMARPIPPAAPVTTACTISLSPGHRQPVGLPGLEEPGPVFIGDPYQRHPELLLYHAP